MGAAGPCMDGVNGRRADMTLATIASESTREWLRPSASVAFASESRTWRVVRAWLRPGAWVSYGWWGFTVCH